MLIHDAYLTGSFIYNGTDISDITGSEASVAALNQFTSSYNTGSFTGSFRGSGSGLNGVVSASFATTSLTSSFANNLTVTGTITAQTLNVQQVTSSVIFSSGSNVFGNSLLNTQVMTGSVNITGSLNANGSLDVTGTARVSGATNALDVIGRNAGEGSVRFWNNRASSITTDSIAINMNVSNTVGMTGGKIVVAENTNDSFLTNMQFWVNNNNSSYSPFNALTIASTGASTFTGSVTAASFIPTSSTIPTNGMYLSGTNTLGFATNSTLDMILNATGNLGLGVTPSAWSGRVAMQISPKLALWGDVNQSIISHNIYTDPSDKYIANGAASIYTQSNGSHIWLYAPSGTAGNAITFTQAMTLDASGNLGLGVTPSAWSGNISSAIEGRNGSAIAFGFSGLPVVYYLSNAFFNGSNFIYKQNGFSAYYGLNNNDGSHIWNTAPSGTAGNAITFTQAMTLSASGNLGIGTTTMSSGIPLTINAASGLNTNIAFQQNSVNKWFIRNIDGTDDFSFFYVPSSAERFKLTSTGAATFTQSNGAQIRLLNYGGSSAKIQGSSGTLAIDGNNATTLEVNSSEVLRATSGGYVGIGTSSPATILDVRSSSSATIRVGSITHGGSGDEFGNLEFYWADPDSAGVKAKIYAKNTGNVGPGGGGAADLLFATETPFGSLTERMRIDSAGIVMIGTTNTNPAENNVKGVAFYQDGRQFISSMDNEVVRINRGVTDGVLVFFHQAGVAEGNISVSGTTVSYNGGHLSRYSQTETYQRIEGLLKGTVMSNLDKMAEWIDPKTGEPYANEQLNCMKISDVEADVNVAGVFVNWDDDDKSFTSDMNIAMTGDMIIRIAQGVVVEKGQLLISAGDGTAKPQEDDIVRSKTIAKVTSNHITCVYEDGSYCVPCVLMAC